MILQYLASLVAIQPEWLDVPSGLAGVAGAA